MSRPAMTVTFEWSLPKTPPARKLPDLAAERVGQCVAMSRGVWPGACGWKEHRDSREGLIKSGAQVACLCSYLIFSERIVPPTACSDLP